MKDQCITVIKQAIKRKAIEKFMDIDHEKNERVLKETLEQAENLMQDLKGIIKYIVPCFPPSYEIF